MQRAKRELPSVLPFLEDEFLLSCVCANRIFVQSSVYADFAAKLSAKVSSFVVGDGLDEKTWVLSHINLAANSSRA